MHSLQPSLVVMPNKPTTFYHRKELGVIHNFYCVGATKMHPGVRECNVVGLALHSSRDKTQVNFKRDNSRARLHNLQCRARETIPRLERRPKNLRKRKAAVSISTILRTVEL